MKVRYLFGVALLAAMASACSAAEQDTMEPVTAVQKEATSQEPLETREETSGELKADGETRRIDGETGFQEEGEVQDMIPLTIRVGEREYSAVLYDNETTRALAAKFPMTVIMDEMNGNEKYHYLSGSLPTDTKSVGSIRTGDLMLYGSNCLVLFYEDFRTSYRYTRLGYVENPEGLAGALGGGSVQVTFESGR